MASRIGMYSLAFLWACPWTQSVELTPAHCSHIHFFEYMEYASASFSSGEVRYIDRNKTLVGTSLVEGV